VVEAKAKRREEKGGANIEIYDGEGHAGAATAHGEESLTHRNLTRCELPCHIYSSG